MLGSDTGGEVASGAAVPGLYRPADGERPAPSWRLEVDSELFSVGSDAQGGTQYTWLSGPNDGYGFGSSGPPDAAPQEHRERVRTFLAQIDPVTGYIEDD